MGVVDSYRRVIKTTDISPKGGETMRRAVVDCPGCDDGKIYVTHKGLLEDGGCDELRMCQYCLSIVRCVVNECECSFEQLEVVDGYST